MAHSEVYLRQQTKNLKEEKSQTNFQDIEQKGQVKEIFLNFREIIFFIYSKSLNLFK